MPLSRTAALDAAAALAAWSGTRCRSGSLLLTQATSAATAAASFCSASRGSGFWLR